MNIVETVLFWTILIGLTGACVIGYARKFIRRRRINRQIETEWRSPQKKPPLIEQHVRIIDKRCYTESVGIKTPICREVYIIIAATDDGKKAEHTVDKEMYLAIPDNAVGTLAIVGDRVYGFCED